MIAGIVLLEVEPIVEVVRSLDARAWFGIVWCACGLYCLRRWG